MVVGKVVGVEMKEPFDFQALVRDYGWLWATEVRENWQREQAMKWAKAQLEVIRGWRRVFRGAEGGK
jgi:hypothetical protein